jgi:hypothetical protein
MLPKLTFPLFLSKLTKWHVFIALKPNKNLLIKINRSHNQCSAF